TGIVIAGLLGLSVSAQAIDAREITDELFAGPDAISADEVMNDAAFEALRLALAAVEAPEQALTRQRYADLLSLMSTQAGAADLPGGVRAERCGQNLRIWRSCDAARPTGKGP
ncbi:hypothetical protein LCGC14_3159140, partial [marine sediment metagenome]